MSITECPVCGGHVFEETISKTLVDLTVASLKIVACKYCEWITLADWTRDFEPDPPYQTADSTDDMIVYTYPEDFNEDTTVTLP